MYPSKRDLFLLTKKENLQPEDFKKEIAFLSKVLDSFEGNHNFYLVNEVIDINRLEFIQEPHIIEKLTNEKNIQPFVFFLNKN